MAVTDRITSWVPYVRLWHGEAGEVWRAMPAGEPDPGPADSAEPGRNHILKVATDACGAALLRAEADATSLLAGGGHAPGANAVLPMADGAPGFDPPWLAYTDHGNSLAAHVAKRGTLDESATANLLRDILAGLAFAESRGVIHGALTPASVIIDAGFNGMLTDFRGDAWFCGDGGSATDDGADRPPEPNASNGSGRTGPTAVASVAPPRDVPGWRLLYAGDASQFCEPMPYIAPEARTGVPLSRSDQWSAGMVAAYALLGDTPGRSADAQLGRAGISMTMRRIILRLTDPNPINRYESAAAAMKVVEAIYLVRSSSVKFSRLTNDPDANEESNGIFSGLERLRPVLMAVLVPLLIAALAILMMNVGKVMGPPPTGP